MLKQRLQHKLLQKLSPQQIQLMKLIQLPISELEQRIKEELEANPALEEIPENEVDSFESSAEEVNANDTDESNQEFEEDFSSNADDLDLSDYDTQDDDAYYKYASNNTSADDEERSSPFSEGISFQEYLIDQIGLKNLTEKQRKVALYIIGNIDDDGYLRRELSAISDDLAFHVNITFSEQELSSLLKVIQTFDPPGVGCRDLQECLYLQLIRKSLTPYTKIAIDVIQHQMDEFTKKHYDKITKKLNITDAELRKALDEILKLNPKPGGAYSNTQQPVEQIIPDFLLQVQDGQLEISLNNYNTPELKINRDYAEMIDSYSKGKSKLNKNQKEEVLFIKQKLDGAKWFIDAIRQRHETLLGTMGAIVNYQEEYFLTGDETKLKPMILKDIAEIVGMDISTISRVANSKYIQTPYGTFLLKSFFSESLQTDSGEEVSTREVKKILQECIDGEDKKKPLTDDQLTIILKEKSYNIARRTVAKYREQLDIPVARLRKQL
ncbi:MAG: RNA polymerase sigma-54 factor [Bacteroidetes bacterium RIFCSPLOWO2_12_FULL_31_6]|nr:MAG: RNA polymerase sigma-54 factor [Bacteroidetes bacterium RIFCSPLOWO2_12_FULL_31_6]